MARTQRLQCDRLAAAWQSPISTANRSRVRRLVTRLAAGSGASLFKVEGTLNYSQYWLHDSWDFVNGALDQGLLWWLFYLRLEAGTWAHYVGHDPRKWKVDHFWGHRKPWHNMQTRAHV